LGRGRWTKRIAIANVEGLDRLGKLLLIACQWICTNVEVIIILFF
jgi:hypothetical protein